MTQEGSRVDQKRAAAEAAVAEVRDGMVVGLGTGTTAAFAVAAIGARVRAGLRIGAVATSDATAALAARAGIAVTALDGIAEIDLAIDGVDEIDDALRAIKGAGGAMLREKIVARAARRMIAIADGSKAVRRLGGRPIPAEVLPQARAFVARQLTLLGCDPVPRRGDDQALVRTDQGNVILDCHGAALDDAAALARAMEAIPGLLGHGLFLTEIDALYLATAHGVVCTDRPR